MPDRYGEPIEPADQPIQPGLRSELHAIALTVPCRYCHAPAGKPCTNQALEDRPPTRIPHTPRITDAEEIPF